MSGKNNIKVVFFGVYNSGDILTGPEKVCKRIFEEYSRLYKTLFIQYFQGGESYNLFKKLFGYEKTYEVNGSEVLKLGIFRMLFEVIKINPKYIHIVCFSRFVVFLYLIKIFIRTKIYYTLNGIIRHENKFFNKEGLFTIIKNIVVENVLIYSSDRIFYLSELSKNIMSLYYLPDNSKLSVTLNGIDNCFLESKFNKASKKGANNLVFIGDINQKEKGFDFLFNSLLKNNNGMKLFVIDSADKKPGINPDYKDWIEIVDRMTPAEMIVFLRDKKIIVAASKYDTFNISVLEAVSCGLYPILTKQTGLSEIIKNFVTVSVVEYYDKTALIQIIQDVFSDKLRYELLNDLKLLSWENILNNYYLPYYD